MKQFLSILTAYLSLILSAYGQAENTTPEIPITFQTIKEKIGANGHVELDDIKDTDADGKIKVSITLIDDTSKVSKLMKAKFYRKGVAIDLQIASPEQSEDRRKITYILKEGASLNDATGTQYEVKGPFNDVSDQLLVTFTLKLPKQGKDTEETTIPTKAIVPDYLSKIKELFGNFVEDKIYKEDNVIHLFVGEDLQQIPRTVFPDCNERSFVYVVHYLSTDNTKNVSFSGRENKGPDLVVQGENIAQAGEKKIHSFTSQPIGPFDLGIDIFIKVEGKPEKVFTIPACSIPYHVSIAGGFFASSLNNPTDITQPGGANSTLYANNATSHKALTIMAIFYPQPRDRFYKYKELNFWQKWSVSFGTKLSQNLFDDLFLGLNYEFAKAGNFTAGVHYGQHTVVQGFDKFRFGEDKFPTAFSNSNTNQRWDFGLFIGVSLDLRVINALRGNSQDQNRRNNPNNN